MNAELSASIVLQRFLMLDVCEFNAEKSMRFCNLSVAETEMTNAALA
jgi:hypothetical protein